MFDKEIQRLLTDLRILFRKTKKYDLIIRKFIRVIHDNEMNNIIHFKLSQSPKYAK